MDAGFFLKGLAIGFSIAAPVGPIGLLTIRRTLASGWASGFATGLGAASADALYGAVAALGLTAVSALLIAQEQWLRLAGGIFLIYLGWRTGTAQPARQDPAMRRAGSLWRDYLSSLALTATNPATILSFVAVFAGLGLAAAGSYGGAMLMVLGVFLGSALWWLILSATVRQVRDRLRSDHLRWINLFSGTLLAGFGLLALLGGL